MSNNPEPIKTGFAESDLLEPTASQIKRDRKNDLNLKYYHRNREKNLAWQRAYRKKVKDQCYQAYGGYVCKCCGITEPSMLALDHVDNDGYKHREEMGYRGGIGIYLWMIRENFPPMFQVLCYNCNQSKRINGGTCAHQKDIQMPHNFEQSGPGDTIMNFHRPEGHAQLDEKLDKAGRSPWLSQLPMEAGLESPETSDQSGSGHGDSGYSGVSGTGV